MLTNTTDAIKSIVAIDPTMDDAARRDFMALVRGFRDGKQPAENKPQPAVCVVYEEAARRLGCSKDMVRYLRRKGRLDGVTYSGVNCHGVTEASLNAFINGERPAIRGRKKASA